MQLKCGKKPGNLEKRIVLTKLKKISSTAPIINTLLCDIINKNGELVTSSDRTSQFKATFI